MGGETWEMRKKVWSESLKAKDHYENIGLNGRKNIKTDFKETELEDVDSPYSW